MEKWGWFERGYPVVGEERTVEMQTACEQER